MVSGTRIHTASSFAQPCTHVGHTAHHHTARRSSLHCLGSALQLAWLSPFVCLVGDPDFFFNCSWLPDIAQVQPSECIYLTSCYANFKAVFVATGRDYLDRFAVTDFQAQCCFVLTGSHMHAFRHLPASGRPWGCQQLLHMPQGTEHAQPDLIRHLLTTQLVNYCIWDLLCESLSKFLASCLCHRCLQEAKKGISLGMPARSIKLILDCLGWSQSAMASWSSRQPFVHARQLEAGVGCRSASSAWAQDAYVHDMIILYITHKQVST